MKVEPAKHLRHFRSKVLHVSQFGRTEQAAHERTDTKTIAVGGGKTWSVTVGALCTSVFVAGAAVFALDTSCILEVEPRPTLPALVVAVAAARDGGACLALVVFENVANVTALAGRRVGADQTP